MHDPLLLKKVKKVPSVKDVKKLRLVILRAGSNNQYTTLEEIEIYDPLNNKVSHNSNNICTASSTYSAGGVAYDPKGPINGVIAGGSQKDYWCPIITNVATTARTLWWMIEFQNSVEVNRIRTSWQQMYNRVPYDMDIEISSDGTIFEILSQIRNKTNWVEGTMMDTWPL